MLDRRRTPRYRLDATIAIGDATARVLDLSSNGLRFESDRRFVPGDAIALVIPLEWSGPGACVSCHGQVVRVEPRGARFAVAATYEPVQFNVTG
jgi:hypothetical protein